MDKGFFPNGQRDFSHSLCLISSKADDRHPETGVSVVNNHVYCELRPTTDTYSKKGQTYGSLCYREGREHPVLQGVLGGHLGIGDVLAVAGLFCWIYYNAITIDYIHLFQYI